MKITHNPLIGKRQGEVTQHPMGEIGEKWWKKTIQHNMSKSQAFLQRGQINFTLIASNSSTEGAIGVNLNSYKRENYINFNV